MRKYVIAVLMLMVLAPGARAQAKPSRLDDTQARVFLRYLGAVAEHRDARALIDTVMASRGTALIIAQQNLVRRVSAAEYREVLTALAEGREPDLQFDRTDPRSLKGAEGLVRDVLPALKWGSGHVEQLQARLTDLAALDVEAKARDLTLANLPESVPLDVPLLLVMGGRAGAAATGDGIYFDVLVTSFRAPDRFPGPDQVVEYFAHEMHHVGLGRIVERRERSLHLDDASTRALSLVSGLAAEGGASYLINGHRNLAAMRQDPTTSAPGTDAERMQEVERALTAILEGAQSPAAYDQALAKLSGNALHLTGAAMLDAIWRDRGRAGVMTVLRDPRRLLLDYDQSACGTAGAFCFSAPLAQRVASLGSR